MLNQKSNYKKLNVALLCDFSGNSAGTILDHIKGIANLSAHNVVKMLGLSQIILNFTNMIAL